MAQGSITDTADSVVDPFPETHGNLICPSDTVSAGALEAKRTT
jgi:hypothetical protein